MVKLKEITKAQYTANVINSIAERYKEERQESKAITFLL